MLVPAGRSVRPGAFAEFQLAFGEVLLELAPLGVGGLTVLLRRADGSPPIQEGAVGADQVVLEHGQVGLRRGHRCMAEQAGGDMDRKPAGDGVGGEDPAEVVREVTQRLSGLAGDPGPRQRAADQAAEHLVVHHVVLPADAALEQVRQRRPGDALAGVVAGDQRDHAVIVASQPADDRGQDAGQLRADQQPLDIGLGRDDLSKGTTSPVSGSW